jgi:hypothetical protein
MYLARKPLERHQRESDQQENCADQIGADQDDIPQLLSTLAVRGVRPLGAHWEPTGTIAVAAR